MAKGASPAVRLGYCTNVHPGETPGEILSQVVEHGSIARRRAGIVGTLDVGLWLPARAAEALDDAALATWRETLRAADLSVMAINAFPYEKFHEPVVKHAVYRPAWGEPARSRYTHEAGRVLRALSGGAGGSVSTVPIGWPAGDAGEASAACESAGRELRAIADRWCALGWAREPGPGAGPGLTIDLEPEPGCILQTSDDVISFFDRYLPGEGHRRVIGVCHDVCHAAVMFEDQETVLRDYARAGISVNRVQVSSAPRLEPGGAALGGALDELRRLAEPRYLHQTTVRAGSRERRFDDLAPALAARDAAPEDELWSKGEWRVHFHVPVFLPRIGRLGTTQDQILPAVRAALAHHGTRIFEVETYAWSVLPDDLRPRALAEGIGEELRWAREVLRAAPARGAGDAT